MTRRIKVGDIYIGGGAPISIQSMTNTPTHDVHATVDQINALAEAGCDIVRFAVNNSQSASAVRDIVDRVDIPTVADIHFDYKLAITAMENGISKVRINPGNIGDESRVKAVIDCAKMHSVPIRIGVNSGSIDKDISAEYGNSAEALVNSALRHVEILERYGFYDVVISVKASDTKRTIEANRILAKRCDYPLHIGVTEAGLGEDSLVKSSVALGSLIVDGIGDTMRVSMTGDPIQEIYSARQILRACGVDKQYVEIVSCPTCARTEINCEQIVARLKERYATVRKPLKVAVMGCVVNGIGEGKDSDIGCAGGKDKSAIFAGGEIIATVDNEKLYDTLVKMIDERLSDK